VAKAAIEAGADIVNDISGGTFDPKMLSIVREFGVPIIFMHMRGTPESMQSMTTYDNVVMDVSNALLLQCDKAQQDYGIHRWKQIIDPGIGFAKDIHGNLALLHNLSIIRTTCQNRPILLGTSRKGFIGTLSGVKEPQHRDVGTIASYSAAICLDQSTPYEQSCTIIRVHNVPICKQAMLVMDAIRRGQI
jgi:dihydropteroate synthase